MGKTLPPMRPKTSILVVLGLLTLATQGWALEQTFSTPQKASLVDAALVGRGHVYLFSGTEYLRYTKTSQGYALDAGYPLELPGNWQGLPSEFWSDLDAAFYNPDNGKTYFFKGPYYIRLNGVRVDAKPKLITEGWQGIPDEMANGIDAAVYRGGHVYFFKGPHYTRFTNFTIDSPTRRDLPGGWELPPLWDSVNAATIVSQRQKIYLFRKEQYARLSDVALDDNYPRNTTDFWPGTVDPFCLDVKKNPKFASVISLTHTDQETKSTDCEEFDDGFRCTVESVGGAKSIVTWSTVELDPAFNITSCASVETLVGGSSERRPGQLCHYGCSCYGDATQINRISCSPGLPGQECTEGDCQGDESETLATLVASDFADQFLSDPPADAKFKALCEESPEQRTESCVVTIDKPNPVVVHVNLLHPDSGGVCAEAWDEIENLCHYTCSKEGELNTVQIVEDQCAALSRR